MWNFLFSKSKIPRLSTPRMFSELDPAPLFARNIQHNTCTISTNNHISIIKLSTYFYQRYFTFCIVYRDTYLNILLTNLLFMLMLCNLPRFSILSLCLLMMPLFRWCTWVRWSIPRRVPGFWYFLVSFSVFTKSEWRQLEAIVDRYRTQANCE